MKKRSLMLMLGAVLCAVMLAGAGVPVYAADGLHVDQHSQEEIKDHIANSDSYLGVGEEFVTEPVQNTVRGKMTEDSQKNGLGTLNDIRYIAGLAPVELYADYEELAQAAAFVNMSTGIMTHNPDQDTKKPEEMSEADWNDGCVGAGSSNLAMGYGRLCLAVLGWAEDSDCSNVGVVGHRRWVLNPQMGKTGFGAADMYYAMYAFDTSGAGGQYNVAWPAANMPIQYFGTDTAWSISTGRSLNRADVKVTLTRLNDGKVWTFDGSKSYSINDTEYFNVDNTGYGQRGCIIFRPDNTGGYKAGDEYLVEITCAGEEAIEYTVNFFELYHHMEYFDAKEATPNEEGNIAYWYCDGCDKYFSDEEGQNEISRDEAIIPKIPLEVIDSGSCGADGDNVTWELDNAGTLTLKGSGAMADYEWDGEGVAPFYGNEDIKSVVIEEGITSIGSCAFMGCSNISEVTIPYSLTSIGGFAFNSCWLETINYNGSEEDWSNIKISDGNDFEYTTINTSDEHIWADEYTVDKEATCTEPGQKSIHCTDCGISKHSSITEIPALGHDYGEWTTPQEPSCSQSGIRECVCSRCGLKQTEEIPALEHSFGEWEEIEGK